MKAIINNNDLELIKDYLERGIVVKVFNGEEIENELVRFYENELIINDYKEYKEFSLLM